MPYWVHMFVVEGAGILGRTGIIIIFLVLLLK